MQSRQEEKLAARPNKASAGRDPFADLLFSPRASFIWDHTTCAITWMNAAARTKFGIDAKKVQAALPARTAARLAEGFEAAKANGTACGTVRFKAGRYPAVPCTFEVMELAGGHKGLIVSEAAATQEPANVLRLPTPPKKKSCGQTAGQAACRANETAASAQRSRCGSLPTHTRGDARLQSHRPDGAPAGAGETACRHCRTRGACKSAAATSPARPGRTRRRRPDVLRVRSGALPRSRLRRHPHGKAGLSTLAGAKRACWENRPRMSCRPRNKPSFAAWSRSLKPGAKVCRDTLLLSGEAGGNVPCRAVLSRWPDGNAHYFLALLSLNVPARLKRSPAFPQITRLAA